MYILRRITEQSIRITELVIAYTVINKSVNENLGHLKLLAIFLSSKYFYKEKYVIFNK